MCSYMVWFERILLLRWYIRKDRAQVLQTNANLKRPLLSNCDTKFTLLRKKKNDNIKDHNKKYHH